MYDALYVLYNVMGLELMSLVWINAWIMVGWLDRHEIVMLDKSMVGWRDIVMVWDWRNSMKLLVRFHGGVGCDGSNFMNLLVRFHGGAIVYIIR